MSVRSLCLSCRRSSSSSSKSLLYVTFRHKWSFAGGQTRHVDPMSTLTHRLRRWANISPVLGYHVVFDVTLNVGHRWQANINPALVQSIVTVPPICRYLLYVCSLWSSQQARRVRPVLVQCWPTVCGPGSELYWRWVDVYLVLLWWRWGLLLSRHYALA